MARAKPESTSPPKKPGAATAAWRKRSAAKPSPAALGKLLVEEISRGANCDVARVRDLLKKGAPPDSASDSDPALVIAARHNLVPVIKALLAKGADVDAVCDQGQTALFVASYKGYAETAALALAHGADGNRGSNGSFALILAADYGYTDIVKGLLDHGAQVDVQDSYGKTPLIRAAFHGFEEIVRALLDKGADINIADEDGRTPLMHVGLLRRNDLLGPNRHSIAIAQMLLDAGADTRPQSNKDLTALAIAEENGQREIRELIHASDEKNTRADIANGLPLKNKITVGRPLQLKLGKG